jgi:NADPH:quinone reductase-like Zn-dependent oxidoreductase
MRAFVLSRYGGPEFTSLTDVPQPSPRAGELLIRVHAAGLNPVDYKTRAGALRVIHKYPLPIVMGNELSGVVEAVGPGVMRFAKSDRVFARVDKDIMGGLAALFWVGSLTTRLRAARHGVSYRYLFMHPSGADLAYLASLMETKKLEVVIDRVFPFSEAKEALTYLEAGHAKGKVVLAMR